MKIEEYSFGRVVIDGKEYNDDLILFQDHIIQDKWWRSQGHLLKYKDLDEYIEEYNPQEIIIGTGYYGTMDIDDSCASRLKEKGIKVTEGRSKEMVDKYIESDKYGLMACFHLTC